MTQRFNPPPGWPAAPEGWTPPPGWTPDPSWPTPPPGWQLWVDDSATMPVANQPLPPGAPTPGTVPPVGAAGAWTPQPQENSWQAQPIGLTPPEQPKKGKGWLIPVIIAVVAIITIVAVLFATGVLGGGDDDPKPAASSATPTETAEPTDEPTEEPTDDPTTESPDPTEDPTSSDPGQSGTRDEPLAIDSVATLGDWSTSLGASNPDAWPTISAEFSEYMLESYAPEEGFAYVMAPLTLTYNGADVGSVYDISWVFVSSTGVTYDDECGWVELPNELDWGQELYGGGTTTGNVCISVPSGEVADGVWRIDTYDADYNELQGFFAVK